MSKPTSFTGETSKMYRAIPSYRMAIRVIGSFAAVLFLLLAGLLIVVEYRDTGSISLRWLCLLPLMLGLWAWDGFAMRSFGPYLLLSRSGVEYSTGTSTLRTTWDNIYELRQYPVPMLVLRQPGVVSGIQLTRRSLLDDPRIPLLEFNYGPGSPLEKDLRAFAPHLFV